jgi:hypothetical protein
MGTSSSSSGPGSNSPLVPPWADVDGQGPGPPPTNQRFRGFRTSLGRFVSGGGQANLRHALGRYAKTATGGSSVASRRFSAISGAGGALYDVISDLRRGGTGEAASGVDLSSLNGTDTVIAIQEIVKALTPVNGDGEKISEAMQVALSECLEGIEEFDPARITDDMLVDMLVVYLRECVFEQIILNSDRAFQKTSSAERVVEAERELHVLVTVVVDKHMRPLFLANAKALTRAEVERIQQRAIADVWSEWEGYI